MAAAFDNIDDVISKFNGTICSYERKPILIKSTHHDPDNAGKFLFVVTQKSGRALHVKLDDPMFNYRDFNLGYANTAVQASWWFRRPLRQYRQGLKKDQMSYRTSNPNMGIDDYFNFSRPYTDMLENTYPKLEVCKEILKDKAATVIAFHRDFALFHDDIHDDFILEYQGKRVGNSISPDLKQYRLKDDARYLQEALQEALPNAYA